MVWHRGRARCAHPLPSARAPQAESGSRLPWRCIEHGLGILGRARIPLEVIEVGGGIGVVSVPHGRRLVRIAWSGVAVPVGDAGHVPRRANARYSGSLRVASTTGKTGVGREIAPQPGEVVPQGRRDAIGGGFSAGPRRRGGEIFSALETSSIMRSYDSRAVLPNEKMPWSSAPMADGARWASPRTGGRIAARGRKRASRTARSPRRCRISPGPFLAAGRVGDSEQRIGVVWSKYLLRQDCVQIASTEGAGAPARVTWVASSFIIWGSESASSRASLRRGPSVPAQIPRPR